MSHGRTLCICGRVVMQCRCIGPHEDTVKAGPCMCPGAGVKFESVEESLLKFHTLIHQQKWDSVWKTRIENIASLVGELHDAEVVIIALKAKHQGAENRVKYLEGLLSEIRVSTAKA